MPEKNKVTRLKKNRNNKISDLQETLENQKQLEDAIIAYQKAINENNKANISVAYERVCRLYQPLNWVQKWFQYRYLYDTREDFVQDFLFIFCTALTSWKPRNVRPESKYGGSGEFKNYFWSCLANKYTNMVKADASGKRNLSSKCPICEAWCNPLSTHLLTNHSDLLWEQMSKFGYDLETLTQCPFCISYKTPKSFHCDHNLDNSCDECKQNTITNNLKKHLLSKHSTYLFDRFQEMYPNYVTLSSRPLSVYSQDSDDEETNLYDNTSEETSVDKLLAHDLTDIQRLIIERILNGTSSNCIYDSNLYNCTQEEFERELERLKDTMYLCGLEG